MPEVVNALAQLLHRGKGGTAFISDIATQHEDGSKN